jgi:hypothetical protein
LGTVNSQRSKNEPEFELIDTGVFEGSKYFDVFVEYAKAGPQDILIKITVHNRGNEKLLFMFYQRFGSEIHGLGDITIISLS